MSSHGVKSNKNYMSMRNSKTSPFNYIMNEKDMRVSHPTLQVTNFLDPCQGIQRNS
jgi:hypothetical protein